MTNTATYDSPDTIAQKATGRGYGIAIVTWPNYRTGAAQYSVVRYNDGRTFVRLSNHRSEAEARKAGNLEWRRETGRAGTCGGPCNCDMIHA